MIEQPNPYAAPAPGWVPSAQPQDVDASKLGPVLHTLTASLPGKRDAIWTVTLHEQHARFVEDDGERRFVLSRAEIPQRIVLAIIDHAVLTISAPVKLTLRMPTEHARTLEEWLGAEAQTWMNTLLARRRRFSMIAIVVLAFLGLLAADMFLLGYAAIVAALFVLTRIAPTRHLFLAEAAVSVAFASYVGWNIYQGTFSWWSALYLFLVIGWVPLNVRLFAFFGPRTDDA